MRDTAGSAAAPAARCRNRRRRRFMGRPLDDTKTTPISVPHKGSTISGVRGACKVVSLAGLACGTALISPSLPRLLDTIAQIRLFGKLKFAICALTSGVREISMKSAQVGFTRPATRSSAPGFLFGSELHPAGRAAIALHGALRLPHGSGALDDGGSLFPNCIFNELRFFAP